MKKSERHKLIKRMIKEAKLSTQKDIQDRLKAQGIIVTQTTLSRCKFTDTCTTCNNEENQSKRVEIKQLIAEIKKKNPYVEAHIFKSVENVNIETVIAYKKDGVKHHFLDNYDL